MKSICDGCGQKCSKVGRLFKHNYTEKRIIWLCRDCGRQFTLFGKASLARYKEIYEKSKRHTQ